MGDLLDDHDIIQTFFFTCAPPRQNQLDWLRRTGAERRGLVILRPAAAAYHLADAGPLLVQDAHHGVQLRPALTRSPPRIVVPSEPRRAA